ncbi:Cell death protease [Umbelopsis sp. WA50703]
MHMEPSDTRQFGHGTFTSEESAYLQDTLSKQLGPEWVSNRPGPGETLIRPNKEADLNKIESTDNGKYNSCVSVIMRVTLKDGTFHEDIGLGSVENCRSKTQAITKAKKEAVTDATKRAIRYFGTVMGNCIYDKYYIQQVRRVAEIPKRFNPNDLYRSNAPSPSLGSARSAMPQPHPEHIPVNHIGSDHDLLTRQHVPVPQTASSVPSSSFNQQRPATATSVNQPLITSTDTVEVKREGQEDSFIGYDDDPSFLEHLAEADFDYVESEMVLEDSDGVDS